MIVYIVWLFGFHTTTQLSQSIVLKAHHVSRLGIIVHANAYQGKIVRMFLVFAREKHIQQYNPYSNMTKNAFFRSTHGIFVTFLIYVPTHCHNRNVKVGRLLVLSRWYHDGELYYCQTWGKVNDQKRDMLCEGQEILSLAYHANSIVHPLPIT